jgi:5'-nucleotidase
VGEIFMKKILILLFVIFLSSSVYGGEKVKIIIFHTNDIHGHIFPYDDKNISENKIGGFQYLSALLKEERKTNPGRVLFLDGGDFAQGTIWSNLDYGISMVEMMNALKYDCSVVGNHEFDWGMDKLENMLKSSSFSVVSSNVVSKEDGNFIEDTKPYILKEIDGVRVGIIGISSVDTGIVNFEVRSSYDFLSPEDILSEYIGLLKKLHKVDLVILISHEGYEMDRELAMKVPGIDIIIGGHTNTVLKEPVVIGNTIIVQAGNYLVYTGKLEIEFDRELKKITEYRGELIKLDNTVLKPDPEINILLEKYKNKYEAIACEVIGKTSVDLISYKREESNIGNLVADIIRTYGHSQIGIINSGAIRENIPSGNITFEKIYSVFPFNDDIIAMDLTGKDILEIMSNNFTGKHGILQISGIKVKYDFSKPEGERLREITIDGKPLSPEGIYRVATIDYLLHGGNDFYTFKNAKNVENMGFFRESVVDFIKLNSPVYCTIEGRQEIINK